MNDITNTLLKKTEQTNQFMKVIADFQADNPDIDDEDLFVLVARLLLLLGARMRNKNYALNKSYPGKGEYTDEVMDDFLNRVTSLTDQILLKLEFPGFV